MTWFVGGTTNACFVHKIGRFYMSLISIFVMLLGAFLLLGWSFYPLTALSVILPVLIFLTGMAMGFGSWNASALHHFPELAGFAGALYGALQFGGSSIAVACSSLIGTHTQRPLAFIFMGTSAACLFFQIARYYARKKYIQVRPNQRYSK